MILFLDKSEYNSSFEQRSQSNQSAMSSNMSLIEENKILDMIYSAGVTDSGEKYKHIALPYDKITNLNNSEKDRLKKHIMLFNKLRKIIVKYSKKWLFYIRIFMARILQVNPQDIHELDVEKFMEYITSGKIPNPRLNLCQIILWVLQDDERVELESFVPENSIGRNSKLFKSKLLH